MTSFFQFKSKPTTETDNIPALAPSTSSSSSSSSSEPSNTHNPSTSTTTATNLAADTNPIKPLTESLSATSLHSVNPWARSDPILTYRRHWNSFTGTENTERLRRGEMPLCTREGRDAAFDKLVRVASGEEERDNGKRESGVWELYRDVDFEFVDGEEDDDDGNGDEYGGGVMLGEGNGMAKGRKRVDSKDVVIVGC